ncbi:MAG TPA: NrfD/PsrC family molybdoenzyme membrane anchor subunit, partial [Blastocatellia bacterium]
MKATEERLQQIKMAAAEGTLVTAASSKSEHPRIAGRDSYYGLPMLKPPVWTWEVPLYFFIGGVSGISAAMAFAAQLFDKDPAISRALLWIALAGAAICPALLIADLGRPSRFLNMLRVFKLRSPMSNGAWILVASGAGAFLAVAGNELI